MADIFGLFSKKFGKPDLPQLLGGSGDTGEYKYPLDNGYPAYIQYRVKKVLTPALRGASSIVEEYKATVPSALRSVTSTGPSGTQRDFGFTQDRRSSQYTEQLSALDDQVQSAEKRIQDARASQNLSQGLLGFATTYRPGKPIRLYFPQAVQVSDNIQYDQVGLGLGGAAGLTALNRGQDIMEAIKAGATETGKSLYSLFNLGSADGEAARIAVARAASMVTALTPAGAQAALGIGLQVKVNPSTRSIFNGVTVRNFAFTYDFYATSPEEAEMVKRIIKKFRVTMYPKAIPESALREGFPLGYEFPDLFEIKFKIGNNKDIEMPQPLLCYLRDVTTSYNPTNMSWHEDGNPTHIQMSLAFQEFRALNQQDIAEGGH